MDNGYLSMEKAYSICKDIAHADEWDNFIDLSPYSKADPKAIELISTQGHRGGVIFGLMELNIQIAMIIAKWGGITIFTNLAHLSREIAALFSANHIVLAIEGLLEIDAGLACELAKNGNHLSLSCSCDLTPEAARELSKHKRELIIKLLVQPHIDVQRVLLYAYEGMYISLTFPSEKDLSIDLFYVNWRKEIKVYSNLDDSGQWWMTISAKSLPIEDFAE